MKKLSWFVSFTIMALLVAYVAYAFAIGSVAIYECKIAENTPNYCKEFRNISSRY